MRKIFLIAAFAGIVFASCSKEAPVAVVDQNDGQQEVTFAAFSKAMTKGVLGAGTLDIKRDIKVAGVMMTTDGQYVDFLEEKTFAQVESGDHWKGAKWDGTQWVSDPVYYPIGGEGGNFSFLAYSETPLGVDEASGDIKEATFARWYGSSQVELQVSDKSARNEIVYAGFKGNKNGPADAAFKHSQALVTVYIHPASGDENKIKINKIGFKDVKTSGTLLLTINPKSASSDAGVKHQWLFNAGCNCAFAEMGNYNLGETVSGDAVASGDAADWVNSTTLEPNEEKYFVELATGSGDCLRENLYDGFFLDRLFPEQEVEAATMVINYTLGGITTDVELALENATWASDANVIKWQAGKRYVYNIKVNVGEILINPESPAGWEIHTIQGTYDPESSEPSEPSVTNFSGDYGNGGEF